jgi:hypothetical protein
MTSRRNTFKTRFMAGVIAGALLAAVGWSFMQLADSRSAASAAGQDLADCRDLAARIELLRGRPAVAGAEELGAADLSRRIEQAARAADFFEKSIERIAPEPARRIGQTNYREVPTRVRIQRVTLQQIFTFLHALSADPNAGASTQANGARSSGLRVRDIRLAAPRGEESGDRWTVESTLTYTVYSPRGKEESAGAPGAAIVERE